MKIDDDVLLSRYLVEHLQPLTEADPTLLANYVVALLKNNKPKKDLQKLCIEQLYDFLGEGTKGFVIKLFHALEDGSVQASQGEKESLNHVISVSVADDVRESRVSPMRRLEKASSSTAQAESDQDDGTDDEDDDRNHKHKRRIARSHSFEKDGQDDEDDEDGDAGDADDTSRGPHKMCNRLTEEQLQGNVDQSIAVLRQGCSTSIMERNALLKSERCVNTARLNAEGNQRGGLRGNLAIRNEAPVPRYDNQNGIFRGPLGRGRGIHNGVWSSQDQRYYPFDGPNFNEPLLPPGPPNIFQSRAIATRGNSPHVPWVGFSHISGMGNGPIDQLIPLNAGMQGGRPVPISHSIGVGINMGMGITTGRPRCPDFEERGYCLRGDLCPMEHGANRIVVEDVQSLSQFNLPVVIPTGRGIGTGSAPLLAPASVSRPSSFALGSRTLREPIEESGISNGSVLGTSITEPDLYDPDQPLWNKDRLDVGARMRRFPQFKTGQDDHDWDNPALEHRGQRTSDDVEADRNAQVPAGLAAVQPGASVWNRIGPFDRNENKGDVVSGISTSGEGSHHGKLSRKDTFEDQNSKIKIGQGKKQDIEVQIQSDLDEATKATPANLFSHGKQMSGVHGESVGHHVDGNNHGSRLGVDRANSSSSHEKAQRTLYVSCIPVDSNKKELLLAHFQKFGDIVDIRIPLHSDRAFVQFSQREDADVALLSPEAVMGNRFIRLAWANRDSISDPGKSKMLLSSKECLANSEPAVPTRVSIAKEAEKAVCLGDTSAIENTRKLTCAHVQPPLSLEQKKQDQVGQMKEEIRRKHEVLAQKREDFRRKLDQLSRQGTATKNDSDPEQLSKRSKSEEREGSSNTLSNAGCLGAAAIPAEAKSGRLSEQSITTATAQTLSIDVPKPTCGPFASNASQTLSVKSPFARQSMTWGPPRYKLDNRTTIFHVLPPFPDVLADIESFREHFSSFGDLSSIELEDLEGKKQAECSKFTQKSVVRVRFASRPSAERAFMHGRWFQGSPLQLVWLTAANTPGVTASTKSRHPKSTCTNSISPQSVGHPLDGAPLVEQRVQKQNEAACGDGAKSEDISEEKSVRTEAESVKLDEGKATELSQETHKQADEKQQTEALKLPENIVLSNVN